jgi:NAD(P)H dehydrogenase (quinone)
MGAKKPLKHVVVLSHPEEDSFNAAVAARYCAEVEKHGQTAIMRDLYRMEFDPVLRAIEQPGSPAFLESPHTAYELEIIADAAVIVFVYPIWFGTPPAMLKGYVDRVLGSDFTFRAVQAHDAKSRLEGKHLLSITSSGASLVWLEEQGQWQSLIQVFDRYLARAFSLASTEHVHFSSIVDGLSERFFEQNMEDVRQTARKMCSKVLSEALGAEAERSAKARGRLRDQQADPVE